MKAAHAFALIGLAALGGGAGLYLATRPPATIAPADIGPAALYAAAFRDLEGRPVSLGRFSGHPLVLNFWATWCAPCREEMPALSRVSERMGPAVQFVGISQEDSAKVRAFAREVGVAYPLWTGGDEVMELSRRLGNRMAVLPFTVVLDASGNVVAQRVGAYNEAALVQQLEGFRR